MLSWYDINLMVSFKDIRQNMFCILAKISPTADLKIYYWSVLSMLMTLKCQLRNMLLKIASWGTCRIIIEFLRIFYVNIRLTWAKSYLTDRCKYSIQNWGANLLLTTNWLSAGIIFHGPNFLTTMQEINAALCIVSNELLHIQLTGSKCSPPW